ncbi:sialoadhesin-like [Pseudorasbora parva]|uniref:sialoadhesin-like n=1 Tax=Pseudorasbora parva TaxID=51549 RepID=UPI00351EBE97
MMYFMLMSVRMTPPLPLIFLLMIHGVSSADWGVSYSPSHICALKDSTVIMRCSYIYPTGHQIMKLFWAKNAVYAVEPTDLSEDPEYSQRLQYLGDKQQNCTIRLSHVTLKDSHEYYFRFTTDKAKWIGHPGVILNVTDLQVESPERVTEGDSVNLTCKSSCTLTDRATFIWSRNSQPLTERRDGNNELLLQSVRREDAGRYSCAVHGHTHTSPGVYLNVTYPPKNVSVSISPSGVIVEGDSVTLSCSSDSNPPALNFSWFKGETIVGSERIYSISKISSDDSGEYKCKSINEHGEKYSDAVTLKVMLFSSAGWGVSYSPSHICALKDSTVIMSCSYTYPTGYQINEVLWIKGPIQWGKGFPDLSKDPEYSQRLQYLGDKQQNCTIRLSHVTLKDSHEYYFRFISNKAGGIWIGAPGVTLTVTDLQVESPERVKEGDSVRLTCKSSCTLTDRATFIWSRNSQPLTERRDGNNELLLQSVRREDAGRYSCAVHGHTHTSPDVYLNVMYPPKSVSVSISPSGVIVEGDAVTLSCSSDSNPPGLNFNWFKGRKFVGSGRIYSISKISSDDSGEYKCKSINEHGEKYSDAVTLNVMYSPRSVSVSISSSGVIVERDSVTLSCSSDSNPPALNFSWFKGEIIIGSGRIYSISKISSDDIGEYKCRSINEHGETYSDAVSLNVMYPPRSVSVSISPSGVIVEGDSVTLNCSSDSNPPAEINWFKGRKFVGSRRIYSISNISSDDSGEYKCRSRNEHGVKYSDAVTLNIFYPPRSVSVSISPSGVIVEGDSVTLSCSSDSNPPALNFSWFKGGTIVGSGRIYSISKISSDDSGEYKCKSINKHGEKYSDTVTLNVMYPPRSVSVSISPSGVIVEGDSVTLNCSSDSKPPAEINWFKGRKFVGSGRIYSISNISSDDNKKYKCKSINEHGEKYSDAVTLNVMYPPKSVSVSISPSGVIVEGDSVTLSCSSDLNPPALNFSWFKGETIVGSGRIYSISNISSDDSGEYKCKSINESGEKYSDAVTLNVMYPPRSVSVLINGSGVIVEGDSVTLSCSSDSNPPALNFSWFKENETSAVGSGQSFSALQSGRFYCQAHNQHGSQISDAVTVTELYRSSWHVVFGITVECGAIFILVIIIITVILFIIKKRRRVKSEDLTVDKISYYNEDTLKVLELKPMTFDLYNTLTTVDPRPPEDSCTTL